MMSLYDRFKTLRESYYGISIDVDRLFGHIEQDMRCKEFIDEHFQKGSKKGVLNITDEYKELYIDKGKHLHTVSLYLLGLCTKNIFNMVLKKELEQKIPSNERWYNYHYTWYLTCLAHDITSVVERESNLFYNIEHISRSSFLDDEWNLLRFERETIMKYLKYRRSNKRIDHGIYAGTQIFDRLKHSFETETQGHDWNSNPVYTKRNLKWRLEHLKHFAYIADAICCHNVWLATTEDEKSKYHKNNLDELCVFDESDKLSIKEYPLQFMLCLLDTIEPVKKFRSIDAKIVLQNIEVDIAEKKITISVTDIIKRHDKFFEWMDSIRKLSEWMQVDVSSCKCQNNICEIEITLKEII